jgi:hypothetical protein
MTAFKDIVFKLVVINELMYKKEELPEFELKTVEDLIGKKLYVDANWVLPEDGFYGMIPEVKAYFEDYDIPAELLASLDRLTWEAGEDLQGEVAPNWDGEDALFDLTAASAEDLALLPNLKSIKALHNHEDESVVAAFKEKGVELTHPYA